MSSKHARDYATYHYAMKAASKGTNPYLTSELSALSRAEKTRSRVHPFFYPPPALLWMTWSTGFELSTSVRLFFFLNQIAFISVLLLMVKRLQLPLWGFGFVLLTYGPIHNSIYMGQANLIVLLFLCLAIFYRNGASLSIAAMSKMSPALIFFQALIMREKKLVLHCALGVLTLSLISLMVVPFSQQLYFYQTVLPGFASGNYHELQVPIDIPANHSIPNLFHQIWPGEAGLSKPAKIASSIVNLSGFCGLLFFSHKHRAHLVSCMAAMVVWLTLFPAYTYEHHLSFLLLPFAVCIRNVRSMQNKTCFALLFLSYFWVALPLNWLKSLQKLVNDASLKWLLQESKFLSALVLLFVLLYSVLQRDRLSINHSVTGD